MESVSMHSEREVPNMQLVWEHKNMAYIPDS